MHSVRFTLDKDNLALKPGRVAKIGVIAIGFGDILRFREKPKHMN
jgi:hypothetical protein